MEVSHALEMSLQRTPGRLSGLCRCGARLEADSVRQLQQELAEHGLRQVPQQPFRR